jgi:hypothetical protein
MSFGMSTEGINKVNYWLLAGADVSWMIAVSVKKNVLADLLWVKNVLKTLHTFSQIPQKCEICYGECLCPSVSSDTRGAQDVDDKSLCKNWPWYSPKSSRRLNISFILLKSLVVFMWNFVCFLILAEFIFQVVCIS